MLFGPWPVLIVLGLAAAYVILGLIAMGIVRLIAAVLGTPMAIVRLIATIWAVPMGIVRHVRQLDEADDRPVKWRILIKVALIGGLIIWAMNWFFPARG
jgi:hypothetical protein